MALRPIGTLELPAHRGPSGFDHASVFRGADRLYVAHTANDSVEVIDLSGRVHEATLERFPGVAGAAVCEQRALSVHRWRSSIWTAAQWSLGGPDVVFSIRAATILAEP